MAKSGSRVGYWIAIAILAVMLFGSFLTIVGMGSLLALSGGGKSTAGMDYPMDEEPCFEEIWSQGYGEDKVVRITLAGVIMRGRRERMFGYEPDMVATVLSEIRAATIDENVKGILLEVDSPGGSVTPSDEIYMALEQFKRKGDGRKIVVFIRDLGASGAYYAAMAGDHIVAEPTAIVGSVGVIMQTLNLSGLGEKIGISSVTIASGENKDMLNPFEKVNTNHVAMLQVLIDDMQDRFASIVQRSRNLESRELLDGRVFTAAQAEEYNLIDRIGYLQDAVNDMAAMLGAEEIYIVRYTQKQSFWDQLLGAKGPQLPNLNAIEPPRFFYLWNP